MKVTFASNYLTHHQVPFCESMYDLLGDDFSFISFEQMEDERVKMGWTLKELPMYEIRAYESQMQRTKAIENIINSDVVILGAVSREIITMRLDNAKGITFRYCERILKKGYKNAISPSAFRYRVNYQKNVKGKSVYMLCASAYLAGDLKLLQAYKDRCYRWGYFPPIRKYERIIEDKNFKQILWVGRLIPLKHPELAIELAEQLRNSNYEFTMKIIGDGVMKNEIQKMISRKGLESFVSLLGNMPHSEVRDHMRRSGIFIATSDFSEGWGAVVNEAMNDGCAVVASHAMGSVPFLVKDGENGLIFKSGSGRDLMRCVAGLLKEPSRIKELGQRAYDTIISMWNAEYAAKSFVNLSETLLQGNDYENLDGPCSRSPILYNYWKR